MFPAFLVLALETQETRDPVLEALRSMARHQRADGSWGRPPLDCACAESLLARTAEADPDSVRKAREQVRALGEDDLEARWNAREALLRIGAAAIGPLREARDHPDSEIRLRSRETLVRLVDTAWPGDVETTALALIAFLEAGYSHLSGDTYDGICWGKTIVKGFNWLLRRQTPQGDFGAEDPVADAIATYAFSEAYGATASILFKDAAQKAVDRTAAREFLETRGVIWRGIVLRSAWISELKTPDGAPMEMLGALLGQPGDSATAGRALASLWLRKETTEPFRSLDADALGPETVWFATLARFEVDARGSAPWWLWRKRVQRHALFPSRRSEGPCGLGALGGEGFRRRLRETALLSLALAHGAYGPAVFGCSK